MRKNHIYTNLSPVNALINLYELGITFCLSEDREYVDVIDEGTIIDGVRYVKVIFTRSDSSKNEVITVNHMVTRTEKEDRIRVDFDELDIPETQQEPIDIIRDKIKYVKLAFKAASAEGTGSTSTYHP